MPLLAVTSPQVKPDSDRMGYTARIEYAGGTVLSGMCFYQSYAREIAEANGWKRLATNSVKLVNILGGYGYEPILASMEECVDAAVSGSWHDRAGQHFPRTPVDGTYRARSRARGAGRLFRALRPRSPCRVYFLARRTNWPANRTSAKY